jgi:ataxia telangiectasia mutated family protein
MATRISLIRSVRQKEKRDQIGTLVTPFIHGLTALETRCLVGLSEAARDANQIQIALNSIVRAQNLEERTHDFDVSQEFACVLWFQKEQKLAIQFLKDLLHQYNGPIVSGSPMDETKKALILARLVIFFFLPRCNCNTYIGLRVLGCQKLALRSLLTSWRIRLILLFK